MALKIVVLASGRGSNFKAIIDAINSGKCDAKVQCLICDNANAPVVEIAKNASIPSHLIERKNYSSRTEFEDALFATLQKYSPQLIVLAGYMRIIRSPKIFEKYKNRIINIHPSLLPKYPGAHAQEDAFNAGEKLSGLTIHIVDETLDGGRILFQKKVDISSCKSAQEAAGKILEQEHVCYPLVIDKISKGEIK